MPMSPGFAPLSPIALACLISTLLAYSQTPASALYNQLLAWLTRGVVLMVPGKAQKRLNGKLLAAALVLGEVGGVKVGGVRSRL